MTSFPHINPVTFVPLYDEPLNIAAYANPAAINEIGYYRRQNDFTKHIYNRLRDVRLYDIENKKTYCQPFLANDYVAFQFDIDAGDVFTPLNGLCVDMVYTIKIYSCKEQRIIYTDIRSKPKILQNAGVVTPAGTAIPNNTPAAYSYRILSQIYLNTLPLTVGDCFYIIMHMDNTPTSALNTFPDPPTKEIFISEKLTIIPDNTNTLRFEYDNLINDFDWYFKTYTNLNPPSNPTPNMGTTQTSEPFFRVEGHIGTMRPLSKDEKYTNQYYGLQSLSNKPYREFDIHIGGNYGVPDYMLDKINMVTGCHFCAIDGKLFSRKQGEEIEIEAIKFDKLYSGRFKALEQNNLLWTKVGGNYLNNI